MQIKLIILFLLFCNIIQSQISIDLKEELTSKWQMNERKKLNYADKYFNNQEFLFVRPIYDSLYKKYKSNVYIGYLLGSCSVYDAKYQSYSESLIRAAESIKSKLLDYDYFLGKALLVNEKYNEAIAQFEKYKLNPLDKETKIEIDHQIDICKSAISLSNKSALAKITNIGAPVNTSGAEYTPVFPSNENFMVFTYRGEKSMGGKQILPNRVDIKNGIYFEDVMISYKDKFNNWTDPIPITAINTNGHDAVVHISHDGQKLFTYRNVGVGSGDIYISKLDG